jgi:hypothetical protein
LLKKARDWPGLEGMDLAKEVSCRQSYRWEETAWVLGQGYGKLSKPRHRVVAVDYGAKRNILRMLASEGCDVTVVPAGASAEDILRHKPDGIFLSNGPGDPAATGQYAVPAIRDLIKTGKHAQTHRHRHSIMIIGAGPIVIGQACEFDYSGAQACKGAEGRGLPHRAGEFQPGDDHDRPRPGRRHLYRADHAEIVERIIAKEKPDASAAHHGRADRAQHRDETRRQKRRLGTPQGRTDRRPRRRHRSRRG